ncbi:hypothetical protein [Alienimonas californiensis]|uniref:Uncharacterized protein n=1 Tax=Alienimonas californiensis TaxID=2527989 RepID=A0A517PFD1_9PLAN|nr:hypothetical protein [Alienimonas californiensis]QDT18069.1 hypothetical protein CA12_42080 [Alienimonas californiensis]
MPEPVRCPACDAPLSADRVDFRRGLTACDHCGVVSKLDAFGSPAEQRSGDGPDAAARKSSAPPAAPVTRPEGWTVEEYGDAVAIRWRWFSLKYVPLAFFCVGWDAFLIFWYAAAFGFGPMGGGPFQWLMVIFPVAHVAVGVGLTYTVICGFFNRTSVVAGHGRVRVRHEPLPWRGSADHDADGFTALFVRRGSSSAKSNQPQTTYDVLARTADGGQRTLLRGLEEKNDARFLAEAIGRALDLPAA